MMSGPGAPSLMLSATDRWLCCACSFSCSWRAGESSQKEDRKPGSIITSFRFDAWAMAASRLPWSPSCTRFLSVKDPFGYTPSYPCFGSSITPYPAYSCVGYRRSELVVSSNLELSALTKTSFLMNLPKRSWLEMTSSLERECARRVTNIVANAALSNMYRVLDSTERQLSRRLQRPSSSNLFSCSESVKKRWEAIRLSISAGSWSSEIISWGFICRVRVFLQQENGCVDEVRR